MGDPKHDRGASHDRSTKEFRGTPEAYSGLNREDSSTDDRLAGSTSPLTTYRASAYDRRVGRVFDLDRSPSMPAIAAILRLNLGLGLALIGRAGRWS
jgi:hypothetical protein